MWGCRRIIYVVTEIMIFGYNMDKDRKKKGIKVWQKKFMQYNLDLILKIIRK